MGNWPPILNKRLVPIPPDAILVDRTTKYGNPFRIGQHGTRAEVIAKHRTLIATWPQAEIEPLRGHPLVCWCIPEPCHAENYMERLYGPEE